jgi:uncharacterized oxidoreductase
MDILDTPDQPHEILVKAVRPLRFAEADGTYRTVLDMLSQR